MLTIEQIKEAEPKKRQAGLNGSQDFSLGQEDQVLLTWL
jgi:hypothetical protein